MLIRSNNGQMSYCILGDINIHFEKLKAGDIGACQLIDVLDMNDLAQVVGFPAHVNGGRIDLTGKFSYIFVRKFFIQ